jgi:hypothetical protein
MDRLNVFKQNFNPAQSTGLEQRLSLLNSFLEPTAQRTSSSKKKTASNSDMRFKEGQLTIVDLSDPFLDTASACSLFEIIVRLFVRADVWTGKVLVVDEAHKVCGPSLSLCLKLMVAQYLSSEKWSSGLTKSLLSLVRQQRHLAMRVIISTQGKFFTPEIMNETHIRLFYSEPTVVPPVLLDLCSVTILHRFSSPSWWDHLIHHVPTDFSDTDAFDKVVRLKVRIFSILFFLPCIYLFELDWSSNRVGPIRHWAFRCSW